MYCIRSRDIHGHYVPYSENNPPIKTLKLAVMGRIGKKREIQNFADHIESTLSSNFHNTAIKLCKNSQFSEIQDYMYHPTF